MKRFTSREIFGGSVTLFVGIAALFAWRVFFDMIDQPDLSNIFGALFWFSFLGALFFLGAVVWNTRRLQGIGTILVFLPSLIFILTWYHIGLVFLSILIVFSSVSSIHDEMRDRIQFRFFRVVRSGSFSIIFGLSLALSSAYFASIERESWEELVPRFSIGEGAANIVFKTVAYFYPTWKNLDDEGMTVDAFLLSLPQKEAGSGMPIMTGSNGSEISPELAEYLRREMVVQETNMGESFSQDLILLAGREQIAMLVGRPVAGDEKIADVFSTVIQNKIVTVLNSDQTTNHVSPQIVPVVLAVLFFLTLIPVGSVLGIVWLLFGLLLFRGAIWMGWLRLERVPREQEILLP